MPCLKSLKRSGVCGLLSAYGRVMQLALISALALDCDEPRAQHAARLLLLSQLPS